MQCCIGDVAEVNHVTCGVVKDKVIEVCQGLDALMRVSGVGARVKGDGTVLQLEPRWRILSLAATPILIPFLPMHRTTLPASTFTTRCAATTRAGAALHAPYMSALAAACMVACTVRNTAC